MAESRRFVSVLVALLAALSGAPSSGATASGTFPALVVPQPFGVSIHRVTDKREFDLMAEAGFKVVRTDLLWERVERERGQYDWQQSDELVDDLAKRGLRPLLILAYSNPRYAESVMLKRSDGGSEKRHLAPVSKEVFAGYVAWAKAAARRYAKYQPIWELWNEPDSNFFWPPQADAKQYTSLATAACEAMRSVDAAATILGPGAAHAPKDDNPDPAFLVGALSAGLGSCLSGISIHPYLWADALHKTPVLWDRMRRLIADHARGGRTPVPVNTESGISTFKGQVSDELQASYLVRMMLLNLASAVPVSIWYDWRDDGDDPDNPEHRFGLLRRNGEFKPAWRAMKFMTNELGGQRIACTNTRMSAGATAVVLRGEAPALRTLAIWNASKEGMGTVELPDGAKLIRALDMEGKPIAVAKPSATGFSIPLGHRPAYLRIEFASNSAAAALCE
jgi:polysaccharide biosynthesis protein PslG